MTWTLLPVDCGRRVCALLCGALAVLLAPPPVQAQGASRVTLVTRAGSTPAAAQEAGPVPSSQTISFTMTLRTPTEPSGALESLPNSQVAWSSPRFHQWLTGRQFMEQFGASAGPLSQVITWAAAQGLSIGAVSPSGLRLSLSGSAARVEEAFAVTLRAYRVEDRLFFANSNEPSLPADLAPAVVAIDGLNNLPAASVLPGVRATSTPAAAGVTLSSNVASSLSGSSIILTADVVAAVLSGSTPSGSVSFFVAGATPRLLGVSTVGAAGAGLAIAVLATPNIPDGNQSVYAVYAGDSNFSSALSNNLSVGISDYNVTFVPQSLTVGVGQSGQTTLVLGLINSFPGAVAFGCTPPPNTEMTCSFLPTTLTGGGTSTMTLQTKAPKTAFVRRPPHPGFEAAGGIFFSGLVGCLLPRRRSRRPALLMVLLAFALTVDLGCAANNFVETGPVTDAGTPRGTASVVINTAGTDGLSTVRHNYTFQVTVQ